MSPRDFGGFGRAAGLLLGTTSMEAGLRWKRMEGGAASGSSKCECAPLPSQLGEPLPCATCELAEGTVSSHLVERRVSSAGLFLCVLQIKLWTCGDLDVEEKQQIKD